MRGLKSSWPLNRAGTNGWSGYRNFARRNGAGIVELLRLTGYNSYGDFMTDQNEYERALTVAAIEDWQGQKEASMPSGGML